MIRFRNATVVMIIAIVASGCVAVEQYSLVPHGSRQVGNVVVPVTGAWNKVPGWMLAYARDDAEVWTREGVLLDRFIVIPGVPEGQPIFVQKAESAALPKFQGGMLAHELAELTESSIVKLFGEGNTTVSTDNLRPHRFGEHRGVMFDFDAITSAGPRYRGVVGTVQVDGKLYLLMYLAVYPYYFDKALADATAQIEAARLAAG